jgi:hypothetical protein
LQARQPWDASRQAFDAAWLDTYDDPAPWLAIISIGWLAPHAAISVRERRTLSVLRRVHRRDCMGGARRVAVGLLLTTVIHVSALDVFVLYDPAFDHHTWRLDGDGALTATTLPAATLPTATLAAAA